MTYEQAIRRLEEIVEKLSNEKISIEESLELYKKGIEYAKYAIGELSQLKGSIELLNKDMSELDLSVEETTDADDDNDDD